MRNFFYSALIGLLICSQAFAGLPPTTAKGQSDASSSVTFNLQAPNSQMTRINATTALIETGNHNLLVNPGFEAGTAGWATSAGSITASSSAGHLDQGKFFLNWGPAATNDVLSSGYISITSGTGISGANGVVSCRFKDMGPGSTASLQAYDGTNILATTAVTAPSNGYSRTSVNFVFPTSGNVRLQVTSNNAGVFNVDDCYLGLAEGFNLSQVSQASIFGTLKYPTTTGCTWSVTQTSYAADFPAQASCPVATVTGGVSAPATKIPAFSAVTMSPADYEFDFGINASLGGNYVSCRIVDESGNQLEDQALYNSNEAADGALYHIKTKVNYSTSQSNKTFKLQCLSSAGAVGVLADNSANAAYHSQFSVIVKKYPSASQQVYGPDATAASWSGYLSGASGTTSAAAYTDLSSTGATITQVTATNISCTTSGTSVYGISCTVPRAGKFNITATGTSQSGTSGSNDSLRLVDGSGTIIDAGKTSVRSGANVDQAFNLQGDWSAAGAGTYTFKIQGGTSGTVLGIVNGVATGSPSSSWTVHQVDVTSPAPLTNGSVTSNSSGLERMERISFSGNSTMSANCTSTPCTIATQSGSWVTSVSHSSTGVYVLNIPAGEFSAQPTCVSSTDNGLATSFNCEQLYNGGSSTAVTLKAFNASHTLTDGGCHAVCMGPR
jgi:hypothetical protein